MDVNGLAVDNEAVINIQNINFYQGSITSENILQNISGPLKCMPIHK